METETTISIFQVLAQGVLVPFIIAVVAGLKKAKLVPTGFTEVYALIIGGVFGILMFAGMNDWTLINIMLGLMLGATMGAAAVGVHQMSSGGEKLEDKLTRLIEEK